MTEATLFHCCRKTLGLSPPALLIASDRIIRRWEQCELTVAGPAWVALEDLLRRATRWPSQTRWPESCRGPHGNVCGLI
jgi:hypothetical protein